MRLLVPDESNPVILDKSIGAQTLKSQNAKAKLQIKSNAQFPKFQTKTKALGGGCFFVGCDLQFEIYLGFCYLIFAISGLTGLSSYTLHHIQIRSLSGRHQSRCQTDEQQHRNCSQSHSNRNFRCSDKFFNGN